MRIQDRNGDVAGRSVSAPRPTNGARTPLTKESGRVRDGSHALAPALASGRVPGPLAPDDRQDTPDLQETV